MDSHVYKKIELVGTSKISMEDAIKTAVAKASETVKEMRWFEVVETRGQIEDGKVAYWQVTLKIGFTVQS